MATHNALLFVSLVAHPGDARFSASMHTILFVRNIRKFFTPFSISKVFLDHSVPQVPAAAHLHSKLLCWSVVASPGWLALHAQPQKEWLKENCFCKKLERSCNRRTRGGNLSAVLQRSSIKGAKTIHTHYFLLQYLECAHSCI